MNDNLTYKTDKSKISLQKMQFTVINHRPNYKSKDKDNATLAIEKKLFEVFRKYAHAN